MTLNSKWSSPRQQPLQARQELVLVGGQRTQRRLAHRCGLRVKMNGAQFFSIQALLGEQRDVRPPELLLLRQRGLVQAAEAHELM